MSEKTAEAGADSGEHAPANVGSGPLAIEQDDALSMPLDAKRVYRRKGRGAEQFEYLKTHDVIRTANAIFGFGGWGYRVVEQERIGELEVKGRDGKLGWHVAYRCVVELVVRGADRYDAVQTSGTGYGDGVEYTATARLTASELALKESESDALKRALRNYGDQFGLVLYMNAEDHQRAARDEGVAEATETVYRERPIRHVHAEAGERSRDANPSTWRELHDVFETRWPGGQWGAWMNEAAEKTWGATIDKLDSAPNGDRAQAFRRNLGVYLYLRDELTGGVDFPPPTRTHVQAAFAKFYDGLALEGPEPVSGDLSGETAGSTGSTPETVGARETGGDAAGAGS